MINLKNEILFDSDYIGEIEDLKKIQKALFMHLDIFASLDECALLWQNHSSMSMASWLFLDGTLKDIANILEPYLTTKTTQNEQN